MVPKVEVVQHVYHIVRLILVLQPKVIQHPDFHQRLMMEPLLVSYYFDCHLREY